MEHLQVIKGIQTSTLHIKGFAHPYIHATEVVGVVLEKKGKLKPLLAIFFTENQQHLIFFTANQNYFIFFQNNPTSPPWY